MANWKIPSSISISCRMMRHGGEPTLRFVPWGLLYGRQNRLPGFIVSTMIMSWLRRD
jgi:hypothetical protein